MVDLQSINERELFYIEILEKENTKGLCCRICIKSMQSSNFPNACRVVLKENLNVVLSTIFSLHFVQERFMQAAFVFPKEITPSSFNCGFHSLGTAKLNNQVYHVYQKQARHRTDNRLLLFPSL